MATFDPVSGLMVPDDTGAPLPALVGGGGIIAAQANPALPPVLPQPPPAAPANLIKIDQPLTIDAKPDVAPPAGPPGAAPSPVPVPPAPSAPGAPALPPAPTPVLPEATAAPGARPQLVTSQKLTSPEQVDALKNVDQAAAAIRANTAAGGDLKVQQATQASQQADTMQTLLQQQADERTAARAAFEKRQTADNAAIAKAQADGLKDPDAGESWTHRLLRALAIGLGQYSAAMNHTDNMAAKIFDDDRKQSLQRQKDKIQAAKDQGKLTQDQYRDQLADLDAKEVGQIQAFKAKWQAESARLGIPQARIDADANTLALDKQEADARAKLLNEDRVTVRDETPKEMAAGRPKGAGGGGNLAAEAQVAKAIQDGASPADVRALSARLGLKGQRTDALETQGRAAAKAGAGSGGVDQKLIIHDVDGTPLGLAGTSRAVAGLQSDLRTNTQALNQLLKLREHPGLTPTGPEFHDAVLALAATTAAGKTDTNTAHEKGAITNFLGMPSAEGIDNKIDQLRTRVSQIKAQLNPLPEGYTQQPATAPSLPDKARAARAVMNGEPAAPAPRAATPKVPAAVIQQAKDEVRKNGPHAASARKLLDQQGITVL